MKTFPVKTGDMVSRKDGGETGKILHISEGYAIVDFTHDDGKVRTAYLSIQGLQRTPTSEPPKEDLIDS